VWTSSRRIDGLQATFDHDGIIANTGLVMSAALMAPRACNVGHRLGQHLSPPQLTRPGPTGQT